MREVINLPNHTAKHLSEVIKARGTFIFLSGQVGMGADGVWGGDIRDQTEIAIQNLRNALAAAGAAISDVVRVLVFLSDVRYGAVFNEVYLRHFTDSPPVRSRVQAALLATECLVEIEAIAVVDE